MYALDTLFVASERTPLEEIITCLLRAVSQGSLPASVRFPVRVKLVFRAPVPAYIRDSASPFSAQSSLWCAQRELACNHSRWTRPRNCSIALRERMSWTKLVRSKLYQKQSTTNKKYLNLRYQSRQFVLNTPCCSVILSPVEASVNVNPKRSI